MARTLQNGTMIERWDGDDEARQNWKQQKGSWPPVGSPIQQIPSLEYLGYEQAENRYRIVRSSWVQIWCAPNELQKCIKSSVWHRRTIFCVWEAIDDLCSLCHEKQLVISPSGLGRSGLSRMAPWRSCWPLTFLPCWTRAWLLKKSICCLRLAPHSCTMLLEISRGERKSSLTRLSEIGQTMQQLILVYKDDGR